MGEDKPVSKIITGDARSHKRRAFKRPSKKVTILMVVSLLVLILVSSSVFAWYQQRSNQQVKVQAESKLPGDSIMDKVNAANASGRYDEAITALDAQDDTGTHEVMNLKATVYINKGDYAAALKIYDAIEKKYKLSATEAANAGAAADQSKDYGKAAEYYDIAAERADNPDNALAKSDSARYKVKAEEMRQK